MIETHSEHQSIQGNLRPTTLKVKSFSLEHDENYEQPFALFLDFDIPEHQFQDLKSYMVGSSLLHTFDEKDLSEFVQKALVALGKEPKAAAADWNEYLDSLKI